MSLLYPGWLREMITEADNATHDAKRIIGLGMAGQFMWLNAHAVVFNHQAFDPVAFGTGAGAVIAGLGVAIGLSANAENKSDG